MRFTKTQQHLIDEASKRGGGYAIECGSGRGPFDGRITFGNRERAALHRLVDLGIAKVTHQDSSPEYNRGRAVWTTLIRFELTTPAPSDDQFTAALGPCGK